MTKLTLILVLALSVQVSATAVAQHITLEVKDATLSEVMKEVYRQSGYSFISDRQLLREAKPINLQLQHTDLVTALTKIFANQPFDYELTDKIITAKPNSMQALGANRRSLGASANVSLVLSYPEVRGRVVDTLGNPLAGASIRVLNAEGKRTALQTQTARNGEFLLRNVPEDAMLEISYIGFVTRTVPANANVGTVILKAIPSELEEVEVTYNTGYQQLSKERATGSFVRIDNELLNRRVSTNLIDRIEDVTSGLILNRTGDVGRDPISIRGRSTLGRFSQPLIVIDNFPYDGVLEDINPNDVASITILRDAAAASIWGARAGNGVIVVTTKSGSLSQPVKVSLTANTNWVQATDPFQELNMSVNDYIDIEEMLFSQGFYTASENDARNPVLSPVIETLIAARDGAISESVARQQLAEYRSRDLRNDLKKYMYRSQLNQQYSLGLSGGGGVHGYRIALGKDNQRLGVVGESNGRLTLSLKNDFNLLAGKLKIQTAIYGVKSKTQNQNAGPNDLQFDASPRMYPYARLADEQGNALALYRDFRETFKRTAEEDGLLDWSFIPLEERGRANTESARNDWRLNLGTTYSVLRGLSISGLYQYWENDGLTETVYGQQSYFSRDMVNKFTQVGGNGDLTYAVPQGAIYDYATSRAYSHSGRIQSNYQNAWKEVWHLNALAGAEIKSLEFASLSGRNYGYNPELSTVQVVDYVSLFPTTTNPFATQQIPNVDGKSLKRDRFYSLFANASLQYHDRYLFTVSARKDASNLFGVRTNQKAVPLWSAGLGWTLSEERFYKWEAMPYLKLRISYGYNGNVDRSLTAFTTGRSTNFNPITQIPYTNIVNPPNENLRWERVKVSNLGLDWGNRSGRIRGTFEVYSKKGLDLIGVTPFAPSSGITSFSGNNASTKTTGYDLSLETINVKGKFIWSSVLLISGLKEKVTSYENEVNAINLLNYSTLGQGGNYFPVVGRPLFGVYSLPWAGLSSETGNPVGYLAGETSQEYRDIINGAMQESLTYHGTARPTSFGSFRNTLSYLGLSLSANISYRLGYYFRRSSVQYESILQGRGGHSDYGLRWMNPGDEQFTEVPSMPDSRNSFRDQFYRSSSALIEKGDHIRLQDIRMSYRVPKEAKWASAFRNAEIYLYANNLGMIWKATDTHWDPDFGAIKPRKSIAIGIQFDF